MTTLDVVMAEATNLLDHEVQEHFSNKFRMLGSGMYSRCVEFKDDVSGTRYCMKLGGYNMEDEGGELWLDFCLDNQHLQAVPTIYYHRRIDTGCYLVIMEKLYGAEDNDDYAEYATLIEADDRYHDNLPRYLKDFLNAFEDVRELGYMDMHNQNYMERGDDTMVIIDPFSQRIQ
jgi:hypothetical protein